MKKILALIAIIICQFVSAQEVKPPVESSYDDETIYNTVAIEVKPEYPGGIEEFYKLIASNYRLPDSKEFKEGTVYVTFVVEKNGKLSDIRVVKDPGFGTAEEAIRVLKLSKRWIPAEQKGVKVRCSYSIPIALSSP